MVVGESFIHKKMVGRLKDRAFVVDFIKGEALVHCKDFLFVCHHQRFSTAEAWLLIGELESLGLAKKLSKHSIKLLL